MNTAASSCSRNVPKYLGSLSTHMLTFKKSLCAHYHMYIKRADSVHRLCVCCSNQKPQREEIHKLQSSKMKVSRKRWYVFGSSFDYKHSTKRQYSLSPSLSLFLTLSVSVSVSPLHVHLQELAEVCCNFLFSLA